MYSDEFCYLSFDFFAVIFTIVKFIIFCYFLIRTYYNRFIYKNTGFDYRPFVLNWCMTVKVIDGFAVNPIESLKAEWLYSQGRGRQFRIGEQLDLAKYLSSVCPLTGEALENEEDRKLRLILSKAQQHQRQLKEEISGMKWKIFIIINKSEYSIFFKAKFIIFCLFIINTDNSHSSANNSPSTNRRRSTSNRIQSPRGKLSLLSYKICVFSKDMTSS